jgi:hypothetical protein
MDLAISKEAGGLGEIQTGGELWLDSEGPLIASRKRQGEIDMAYLILFVGIHPGIVAKG